MSATETDRQAVLDTMSALLDSMARHDKAAMRALMVPEGNAVHSRDDRVFHEKLDDLPDRLPPETVAIEERFHDPLVLVDDNIAMIWAPYDFFVDGELDHWGRNIVSFLKENGRWRVSGVADNGWTGPKPDGWPNDN